MRNALIAGAAAMTLAGAMFAGTAAAQGPPGGFIDVTCEAGGEVVLDISVAANAQRGVEQAIAAVEEHHPGGVTCSVDD